MSKTLVLICDDHAAVHEGLMLYLRADGIDTLSAYDGDSAIKLFQLHRPNLIILDIMLPDIPGTDVCKIIRKTSNVPIIMLSARSEEFDRIIGLELGADDYVTKPFSAREIAARVRAILRRQNAPVEERFYRLAELTVIPDTFEVFVKEKKISLRPKEFEVLCYLISNAGKLLSREQILNAVWGYDYYGDTRGVDVQILHLRQKLSVGDTHFAIRSIYSLGYKLEEID